MLLENRAESTLLQHTLFLEMSNNEFLRENSTGYEICILIGHGGVEFPGVSCIKTPALGRFRGGRSGHPAAAAIAARHLGR